MSLRVRPLSSASGSYGLLVLWREPHRVPSAAEPRSRRGWAASRFLFTRRLPGGYSHLLAAVNDAALNICVQVFVFSPRRAKAGTYGSPAFNFWETRLTVPHSGCTVLHSHQSCRRVLVSPHSCQHLLLSLNKQTSKLQPP